MNPIGDISNINFSGSRRFHDVTSFTPPREIQTEQKYWHKESDIVNSTLTETGMFSVYSESPHCALLCSPTDAHIAVPTTCANDNNSCHIHKNKNNRNTYRLKNITHGCIPSAQSQRVFTNSTNFRIMREELNKKLSDMFANRSIIVDILAILFGIGTWIGINGTFIQLPLLVEVAPEGWSLPSYLSVVVQIGNLGPLMYTILQNYGKCKIKDAYIIYGLLIIGTISSLLTAFFYEKTAQIFGEDHSYALFIFTFFTAVNACTSSVVYMPYMGRFKEIYLVTYFIGEGLSGLIPSVVALTQGIGGTAECVLKNVTETGDAIYEKYTPPPRFNSMVFFFFVFVMMVCSFIGFTLLDRLQIAKKQYAAGQVQHGNHYEYEQKEVELIGSSASLNERQEDVAKVSSTQYISLLLLIGGISFFSNGMFNSIQSYSCLPYGSEAYHLTVTLSVIANPVACFLAIFLPHKSLRSIVILCSISIIFTVYVFVIAIMSPTPPLHGTTAGAAIVITVWTLLIGVVSYVKLCITTVMRAQGGKSLVWTGGLTQLGSLIGSVLIFLLINFTSSFKSAEYVEC